MVGFQTTVSLGDLIVALVSLCTLVGLYYTQRADIRQTDYKVEELRRGRGLILEHWPHMVQRCFGWRGGGNSAED